MDDDPALGIDVEPLKLDFPQDGEGAGTAQPDEITGAPPATAFEGRLSAEVDRCFGRATANTWDPVAQLVAGELGFALSDVGAIGADASSVPYNRPLTPSLVRRPKKLVLIFAEGSAERQYRAVLELVPLTRHLTTVGIAEKTSGTWRVRQLVEVEGIGIADEVLPFFPAAVLTRLPLVPIVRPAPRIAPSDLATADLKKFCEDFQAYLVAQGIEFGQLERLDFLAAALGSQFLLFAGPSGTGKSTAAKAISGFLSSRTAALDVTKAMQRPEEFLGYFSQYADKFLETPQLGPLLNLAEDRGVAPPFCVLEEANLSYIEGYLGPAIQGLSRLQAPLLEFPLHREAKPVRTAAGVEVPGVLRMGPYPRILGTVNVDPTAPAPAKKVAGRACVILLEPQPLGSTINALSALNMSGPVPADGAGAGLVGDPATGFRLMNQRGQWKSLEAELLARAQQLTDALGTNVVTNRDLGRAGVYASYYSLLAVACGTDRAEAQASAVENALLHFVLPGLSGEQFSRATDALLGTSRPVVAGGLLQMRLLSLRASGSGVATFGTPPDFWTALS